MGRDKDKYPELISEHIVHQDVEGRVIWANRSAADSVGISPEKLVGRYCYEIWHNRDTFCENCPVREAVETGEDKEREVQSPDGRWWLIHGYPIKNDKGQVEGAIEITLEITDRKKKEQALEISNARLRAIVEDLPFDFWIMDSDNRYIMQNAAKRALWGDMTGKTPEEVAPDPGTLRAWMERINKVREGETIREEISCREDGKEKLFLSMLSPIYREGRVTEVMGLNIDITDLKETEEALRESEARYLSIFNQSLNCIYVQDFEGNFIDANDASLKLLGYSRDEIKRIDLSMLLDEESLPAAQEALREIMKTGRQKTLTEYRLKTKSGDTVWVLTQGALTYREGKPHSILGFAVDITDRKRMEEALRESEDKYRTLIEALPHMVAIFRNRRMVFANPAFLKMFGYESLDEALGISEEELISEDEHKRITAYTKARSAGESDVPEHYTTVLKRKSGELFPAEVFVKEITYQAQPALQVIIQDITERERAQEALRLSEEMYRGVVDASPDGIVYMGLDFNVVMANRQIAALFGLDGPQEAIGKNGLDFLAPEERERAAQNARERLESENVGTMEYKMLHKDGGRFLAEFNSMVIRDARGEPKGYVAVVRDITEKRKIEEELLKAAKLDSLGILAGGIAHDFNNILTAILGNINLVSMTAKLDELALASLNEAEKACYRAKGLTSQLLTFSKGGAPVRKAASMKELLTDTVKFTVSGSMVRAEFNIADDLWPVEVDEVQISQALNNLVVNSIHAMPKGGVISVDAENVALDENSRPLRKGKYIKISIRDEGTGIPDDYIDKIFDPYFTTKQNGSGLGLATTYSVINRHGGHILADSELGKGTSFTIYLPATEKKPQVKKEKPAEIRRGKGKVLLMDDEEIIRKVGKELMEGLGYEVQTASNGAEAIEMYKRARDEGKPVDAVIMDLTVPGGMGGKDALEELLKIDPDARVIVSSGYSADRIMSDYENHGFKGVIVKPYNLRQLGDVLHEVISGR